MGQGKSKSGTVERSDVPIGSRSDRLSQKAKMMHKSSNSNVGKKAYGIKRAEMKTESFMMNDSGSVVRPFTSPTKSSMEMPEKSSKTEEGPRGKMASRKQLSVQQSFESEKRRATYDYLGDVDASGNKIPKEDAGDTRRKSSSVNVGGERSKDIVTKKNITVKSTVKISEADHGESNMMTKNNKRGASFSRKEGLNETSSPGNEPQEDMDLMDDTPMGLNMPNVSSNLKMPDLSTQESKKGGTRLKSSVAEKKGGVRKDVTGTMSNDSPKSSTEAKKNASAQGPGTAQKYGNLKDSVIRTKSGGLKYSFTRKAATISIDTPSNSTPGTLKKSEAEKTVSSLKDSPSSAIRPQSSNPIAFQTRKSSKVSVMKTEQKDTPKNIKATPLQNNLGPSMMTSSEKKSETVKGTPHVGMSSLQSKNLADDGDHNPPRNNEWQKAYKSNRDSSKDITGFKSPSLKTTNIAESNRERQTQESSAAKKMNSLQKVATRENVQLPPSLPGVTPQMKEELKRLAAEQNKTASTKKDTVSPTVNGLNQRKASQHSEKLQGSPKLRSQTRSNTSKVGINSPMAVQPKTTDSHNRTTAPNRSLYEGHEDSKLSERSDYEKCGGQHNREQRSFASHSLFSKASTVASSRKKLSAKKNVNTSPEPAASAVFHPSNSPQSSETTPRITTEKSEKMIGSMSSSAKHKRGHKSKVHKSKSRQNSSQKGGQNYPQPTEPLAFCERFSCSCHLPEHEREKCPTCMLVSFDDCPLL